jgi:hypothetical protein
MSHTVFLQLMLHISLINKNILVHDISHFDIIGIRSGYFRWMSFCVCAVRIIWNTIYRKSGIVDWPAPCVGIGMLLKVANWPVYSVSSEASSHWNNFFTSVRCVYVNIPLLTITVSTWHFLKVSKQLHSVRCISHTWIEFLNYCDLSGYC